MGKAEDQGNCFSSGVQTRPKNYGDPFEPLVVFKSFDEVEANQNLIKNTDLKKLIMEKGTPVTKAQLELQSAGISGDKTQIAAAKLDLNNAKNKALEAVNSFYVTEREKIEAKMDDLSSLNGTIQTMSNQRRESLVQQVSDLFEATKVLALEEVQLKQALDQVRKQNRLG
jgi:hypothetical protein